MIREIYSTCECVPKYIKGIEQMVGNLEAKVSIYKNYQKLIFVK